jgi:outer membrane lipoprotein-sorting protein
MDIHKKIKRLLVDFALGELSPQVEDKVKEHLAKCKQCNSKLKQLEALLKCTENVKQLSTDAQMQESAKEKIFATIDSRETKEQTYRPNISLEFRRIIMKSKITKLAAAAVIIIAVIVGITQLGGSGSSAVYAAVIEQLHNARTMTYSIVTQTNIESMPTVRVEMAFKEPGYMRITTIDGYITVIDWAQNKGISIWPSRQQFLDFEASNYQHDPAQDPFVIVENLRALPSQADVVLGEKDIDGRLLQGFLVTEEHVVNTIWVDPDTKELARVEMEFPDAPGMSVIMTDFQFNIQLDDSLFSLTPPEDYTRLEVQADVSKVTEQDLIEYLQAWSTWTKDGTFPPTFNLAALPKIAMEMEKQGKFGEGETSAQQRQADAMKMYRGIMFVAQLPAQSNWRYAGENIKYGDFDSPIFWYRPDGSETYRVIYGDLSVKELIAEKLPK